jgi:hypothetical protein
MNCTICNHDEHDAGQCKRCNCGESEIIQRTLPPRMFANKDFGEYVNRIYTKADTLMGERRYNCQR